MFVLLTRLVLGLFLSTDPTVPPTNDASSVQHILSMDSGRQKICM